MTSVFFWWTAKWSWYHRGCGYRSHILEFLEDGLGSKLLSSISIIVFEVPAQVLSEFCLSVCLFVKVKEKQGGRERIEKRKGGRRKNLQDILHNLWVRTLFESGRMNAGMRKFCPYSLCIWKISCNEGPGRPGQWYCAGYRHQEGTEEYTTTLGNKNWGLYLVINL